MSSSPPGPFAPHVAAISLGVRDVDKAVAFYEAIGLVADVRSDRRTAVFQLNGVLLYLVRRGVMDPEVGPGTAGEGLVSLRHDVVRDKHIEAILVQVTRSGGRVLRMPERAVSGGRRAWFTDPDGHRWELAFVPANRRDEHGGVWLPPRERLFAMPTAPLEPDTDDLGPAMVTADEFEVQDTDELTVFTATPVVVELEPDGPSADPPATAPAAPASLPPPPPPSLRTASPSAPKSTATLPKPRPPAPPVEPEPPPKITVGRVIGWVLMVAAPVGGGILAWSVLRFALPG